MVTKRFEALDAFRGLCALSVVIHHMRLIDSITELNFFRASSLFVEFFFVLSGFVLTHGYGFKDNLNFKTFMRARFFRIYPLHLFMFFVMVLLELGKLLAYKFGGFTFNNVPFTNSAAISEMIPNLLLIQSWTSFTDATSFNIVSWSISIEFYMYALLFFSIVFFKSYKAVSWFLISLMVFFLIYLGSDILISQVLRGLSCFFGGAFTYVVYRKLSHFNPSYFLGSIIEGVILVSIVLIVQSKIDYKSIIASLFFLLAVLLFSFESGFFSKLLKEKPFQYLGKLSYSIYMTHFAIIFCLVSFGMVIQKLTGIDISPMIGPNRFLDFGSAFINNLIVMMILGIVIIFSSFTYKYIELGGQKLNSRHGGKLKINLIR